jgi:hypothetical protein
VNAPNYLLIPQKAKKSLFHKLSTLIGHFKSRYTVFSPRRTHESFFTCPIVLLRTTTCIRTTFHRRYFRHGLCDFIFWRRRCSSLLSSRLVGSLDRSIVEVDIVTQWTGNIGSAHGANVDTCFDMLCCCLFVGIRFQFLSAAGRGFPMRWRET